MKNQIKAYRIRRNLTQKGLAEILGTSQQYVQRMEAGVSLPRMRFASLICRALHATPCAVFPELASACSGLHLLTTPAFPDRPRAAYLPAEWRVQIEGDRDAGKEYWISDSEARRLQESIAQFFSATAETRAKFLVFRTASKAIAVNLTLVEWIQLKRSQSSESHRERRVGESGAVRVLLKEGIHLWERIFYPSRTEPDPSTNFTRLSAAGHQPLFAVSIGSGEMHFLSTERIALIEIGLDLLRPEESAVARISDDGLFESITHVRDGFC